MSWGYENIFMYEIIEEYKNIFSYPYDIKLFRLNDLINEAYVKMKYVNGNIFIQFNDFLRIINSRYLIITYLLYNIIS